MSDAANWVWAGTRRIYEGWYWPVIIVNVLPPRPAQPKQTRESGVKVNE